MEDYDNDNDKEKEEDDNNEQEEEDKDKDNKDKDNKNNDNKDKDNRNNKDNTEEEENNNNNNDNEDKEEDEKNNDNNDTVCDFPMRDAAIHQDLGSTCPCLLTTSSSAECKVTTLYVSNYLEIYISNTIYQCVRLAKVVASWQFFMIFLVSKAIKTETED